MVQSENTKADIKVYTPSELAEVLKIGKTNTYRLMRTSGFPSYKINNKIFVTETALIEWLNKMRGREFELSGI